MRLYFLFTLCLFSACKQKTASPVDTVAMLQEIGELATTEYTITKVVKASDDKTWFKPGQRKILITTEAVIKAGIDMKNVTEKDISRSGKTITIRLPPPRILSINIPPEKIKVEFEKVTMFRDPFTSKERNDLMIQAEQQIRNSENELGIIDQAKINTQLLLSRVLMQAGFEKVILSYDKTFPAKQ